MSNRMKGWKTYAGALLIALSGGLNYLGMTEEAALVLQIGGALGIIGVAHKIEKAG